MDDMRDQAVQMLRSCVAGRTHQIARIVSARYDQALRQHGVTSNQLTLLCLVSMLQPVRPADMLGYLQMEQSTLSRNLERLEKHEWVRRLSDPEDNRAVRFELTAAGTDKLREAYAGWQEAQEWAESALGQDNIGGLERTAHRLNPLMPVRKG